MNFSDQLAPLFSSNNVSPNQKNSNNDSQHPSQPLSTVGNPRVGYFRPGEGTQRNLGDDFGTPLGYPGDELLDLGDARGELELRRPP